MNRQPKKDRNSLYKADGRAEVKARERILVVEKFVQLSPETAG
jgi:hypothetical protein